MLPFFSRGYFIIVTLFWIAFSVNTPSASASAKSNAPPPSSLCNGLSPQESIDLSAPGGILNDVPLKDQKSRGTCYAEATSTVMSAYIRKDHKLERTSCSTLQTISAERNELNWANETDEIRYSTQSGRSAAALKGLTQLGGCCKHSGIDDRFGAEAYAIIDSTLEQVYSETGLYSSEKLVPLETERNHLFDEVRAHPNVLGKGLSQELGQILKKQSQLETKTDNASFVLLSKLSAREWKIITSHLQRTNPHYVALEAKLKLAREGLDRLYASKLQDESQRNMVKLFHQLVPESCTDSQGGGNPFQDLTAFMAEVGAVTNPLQLNQFNTFLAASRDLCQKTGQFVPFESGLRPVTLAIQDDEMKAFQSIQETLIQKRKPMVLRFCTGLLGKGSQALAPDCPSHFATLAGIRRNHGTCQLKVRDSYGAECPKSDIPQPKSTDFQCQNGEWWINADTLWKGASQLDYIRDN